MRRQKGAGSSSRTESEVPASRQTADESPASLEQAAHDLAEAGWPLFPLRPGTKYPFRGSHGFKDATTDLQQVAVWWSQHPDANIATPTGNGRLVIDVDERSSGVIPDWLPPTLTARTPGGWHLHCEIDEDIKSRAGFLGPGVDVKCSGGYVLLPPSVRPDGRYEWTELREPVFLHTADLEHYAVAAGGAGSKGGIERKQPEDVRRGEIHDQVLAWASHFAHQGYEPHEVEAMTWEVVRSFGVAVDNRNGHIDAAIGWVLAQEARA